MAGWPGVLERSGEGSGVCGGPKGGEVQGRRSAP